MDRDGKRWIGMAGVRCVEGFVQNVGHEIVLGVGYINKRKGVRCQLSYGQRSSVGAD